MSAIVTDIEVYRTLFEDISTSRDAKWENSTNEAGGLHRNVTDFEFCYWLKAFVDIFAATDLLYKELQQLSLNIGYAGPCVQKCVASLQKLRDSIEAFYDDVSEELDIDPPNKRVRKRNRNLDIYFGAVGGDAVLTHRQIMGNKHREALDLIMRCINDRFSSLDQFKFAALLDSGKFDGYSEEFPDDLYKELESSVYAKLFNLKLLKFNLKSAWKRTEFKGNLEKMTREIHAKGYDEDLPEYCKLVRLCFTIPLTVCSAERSFSTLLRVKTKLRTTMNQDRLSALALMSIESGLLRRLDLDRLIDVFGGMENRRIALFLK